MGTWKTRGLRGSYLEDLLNYTNEKYLEDNLALIQKIPTPITPVQIDNESRHITLAYFDKQSTVDYLGNVQGIPVCFDAKECAKDSFPLSNIHTHQFEFMKHMENQEGISFIIIYFSSINKFYYLRMNELEKFYKRQNNGGLKHFKINELDAEYFFDINNNILPYLNMIQKDINSRKDSV